MIRRGIEPRERGRPRANRRATETPPGDSVTVYVGGAMRRLPGQPPRAAACVFYGRDDPRNEAFRIPENWIQTARVAELAATLIAVRLTHQKAELTIVSSQGYVSKAMNKKLTQWEREGWVGVPHRMVMKCLAAELKARKARTTMIEAPSASDAELRCLEAARLAKEEAGRNGVRRIELTVPAGTSLAGVRLQNNKQKIFYRGIREIKTRDLKPRLSTDIKLAAVKESMLHLQKRAVADEEIWQSLRSKDFMPRTAQFLWRAMHNAHRVGDYWKHIPDCEDRAICQECGETEDLEHILLRCESPGAEIVWKAAEKLWLEKEPTWPEISLGTILGCGLMRFSDEEGKQRPGAKRLYKILVSESAYVIWKLRNDRVISRAGDPITEAEIINKWTHNLNQRLQQDIVLANRPTRRNRPRIAPTLVKDTWADTLDDESTLPDNWLKESRVLVGRRALTQNQVRSRSSDGVG
ncbi:hypothetical protein B0H12DRAFT_1305322 [Mycena haematopus]|nr:hypothetical protein B0H12DRAFT_1305322 [Mycena haematopus]